jgi:hypothetical protein
MSAGGSMNTDFRLFLVMLLVPMMPVSLLAQSTDVHPILTDEFHLGLGFFFPDKTLKFRVDGTVLQPEIDFEESLRFDNTEETGNLIFGWRFGEIWQVQGQYWEVSDGGGAILDEDIEWEDLVFKKGTFANAGVGLDVARIFFGRRFSSGPNYEFGLGAGVHWLEIHAFLEGQILTSEENTEFERAAVKADFPMPNIGAWYHYSWSPRWALTARVDWLSASVGDYSGGIWNGLVGVHWAPWRHFGLGLSYNYFSLDGDVDKSDWRGGVGLKQVGPFLGLTTTW